METETGEGALLAVQERERRREKGREASEEREKGKVKG
jgi:hypothetical protein